MGIEKFLKKYKCVPGKRFAYHSATETITYVPSQLRTTRGIMALLHEVAHKKLGHFDYSYDLELLEMEKEAWEEVRKAAKELDLYVDERHIEECLDTYTDWVSRRATCPCCHTFGLQKGTNVFKCIECETRWKVNDRKDRRVVRKAIEK